jgi:hypothetical protein
MLIRFLGTCSFIFGLAMVTGSAQAETVRMPQSGSPAVVIDLPSGWAVLDRSDKGSSFAPDDRSTLLLLMWLPTDHPCDQLAANVMEFMSLSLTQPSAPGAIDGHAGAVYETPVPGSQALMVRVTCVRADAAHAVVEMEAPKPTASTDQVRRLHDLATKVRLEGVH